MNKQVEGMFDAGNGLALLEGAAAAYGDEGGMNAWAEGRGCAESRRIEDAGTDTLCFAAWNAVDLFVVFRGTRDLRNWITDLDVRRVNVAAALCADSRAGGSTLQPEVHEGFWTALECVWPALNGLLTANAPGKRVWFGGHSLGGALAMLAAARFNMGRAAVPRSPDSVDAQQRVPTDVWLYTFGQPRVGDGAWRDWFDARMRGQAFRVVHAEDVVPRVPPLLFGYRHAGVEVFYPGSAGASPCRIDPPWWTKAFSDVFGTLREWTADGRVSLLWDHRVEAYLEMLEGGSGNRNGGIIAAASGRCPQEHGI
jgi:triacylglycerol lipase